MATLIFGRATAGGAKAAYFAAVKASIADFVPADDRTAVLGKLGAFQQASFMVGSFSAGAITQVGASFIFAAAAWLPGCLASRACMHHKSKPCYRARSSSVLRPTPGLRHLRRGKHRCFGAHVPWDAGKWFAHCSTVDAVVNTLVSKIAAAADAPMRV